MARLHEVGKKYNLNHKELVNLLAKLGYEVKDHPFTVVSEEMLAAIEKALKGGAAGQAPQTQQKPAQAQPVQQQAAQVQAHHLTQTQGQTQVQAQAGKPAVAHQHAPQPSPRPAQANVSHQGQPPRPAQGQSQPQNAHAGQQHGQPRPPAPVGSTRPVYTPPPAPVKQIVPIVAPPIAPVLTKEEKKKLGPKPPRQDEVEEVEVNQEITIIKTTPVKKEVVIPKPKKKAKQIKKLMRGAHVPKKMIEEQRAAEAIAELPPESGVQLDTEAFDEEQVPRVTVPQELTVNELAKYLQVDGVEIVKKLLGLGVFASLNQRLEREQIELIGREFGRDISFSDDVIEIEEEEDNLEDRTVRPPVVTIMGHVDHGKTSLLDKIRHARVAEGEVGGITQHIGAYQVKTPQGTITFLDTPGHEAFTAMRAQGTQVTDIAILVVAADDGVQPQTVEAIHHAQAAGVPIIVAVNKIDKPEANAEKVKQQLMPYNLIAEDWGGKTIMCQVSAKRGDGIDTLLEMILLQAEIMELKANADRDGRGVIIEARLDKGMGPMATVLVQNGTVELGDSIICGTSFGRVKALINDAGARVKEAGPSFPVAILGLNEVPRVGDKLMVVESTKFARYVGVLRQKQERVERLGRENRLKLVDLFKHVTEGKVKELNIIIKADVQGSSGALKDSLERLSTSEVKVNAIHAGVGAINESDVMLAAASNAIIIGFHVRPSAGVDDIAARENVEVKVFRIIYEAIDAVKAALKGMYEPVYEEEVIGRAEVRRVFKITGSGAIAGSFVLDGKVQRDATARLVRDGVEVFEGKISSLKRFKDDVREVAAGYECGISISNYSDLKEKDVFELYRLKEVARV
ncbi:MAG: translation initiation factor IF-2 [Candidatus Ozemobacteraceae bacterium]